MKFLIQIFVDNAAESINVENFPMHFQNLKTPFVIYLQIKKNKFKGTMQALQYCELIDFQRRAGFSFATDETFFVLLLVVGHAVQASIYYNK